MLRNFFVAEAVNHRQVEHRAIGRRQALHQAQQLVVA